MAKLGNRGFNRAFGWPRFFGGLAQNQFGVLAL